MSLTQPGWESGHVATNGIRLHYTRTGGGTGKPPLVLAHGFSDDGPCWSQLADALASDHDVVMVDARGHGQSDAPEGAGYGYAEQAADLAGVIDALGLSRPPVLGHSMGAATALTLAGMYPEVPGAILLEDPPAPWAYPASDFPAPGTPSPAPPWITELAGRSRDELIAGQREKAPTWPEAELGPWADAKIRFIPHAGKRAAGEAVDWPALLRRITCPALLITADPEQGAIIKPETAASLKELVPQLRVEHIPDAGHCIRREQSDAFLKVVRAFLAGTASTKE